MTVGLIPVVVIILMGHLYLVEKNSDMLFFMQDRGWWNSTDVFFCDCMRYPAGLLMWMGSYLTQYFFHPTVGTALLIALWILIFFLARCSFKIRGEWSFVILIPVLALLVSIVQLGYWVYFFKETDYLFVHSLGLLSALLVSIDWCSLLPSRLMERVPLKGRWLPIVLIPLFVALLYKPLGFYVLVAAAIIASRELRKDPFFGIAAIVVAVLSIWLLPMFLMSGTTIMRPDQPWLFGFKQFHHGSIVDITMEAPLWVAAISPLFFPLFTDKQPRPLRLWVLVASQLMMVGVVLFMNRYVSGRNVDDYNFHAELRMQRLVEEQQWDKVMDEVRSAPYSLTPEMAMFRDIALINKGELLSSMYRYDNSRTAPVVMSDSLNVFLRDQASDLLYFNYGEPNWAVRRAIERCMHYGYSHYTLRMLTRCALLSRETDVAQKYLSLLSRSVFQKKWAEGMTPFVNDTTLINTDNRFRIPKKLFDGGTSILGSDKEHVERGINFKWGITPTAPHTDPFVMDVVMAATLQLGALDLFTRQYAVYAEMHRGEILPLHVQEAALFFANEMKADIKIQPEQFSPEVVERSERFSMKSAMMRQRGLDKASIIRNLRSTYGDTFYWDYCAKHLK